MANGPDSVVLGIAKLAGHWRTHPVQRGRLLWRIHL